MNIPQIAKDSIQSIGVSATQADQQIDSQLPGILQNLGINTKLAQDLIDNNYSLDQVYNKIKDKANTTDINTIVSALPEEGAQYNTLKNNENQKNAAVNAANKEVQNAGNMYNANRVNYENYIQTLQNEQNRAKIYNKGFTLNNLK